MLLCIMYEASDGREAIEIIYRNEITLFLCDLNMPKFDGERMINTLRANKLYRKLKIIMITVERSRDVILPLIKKGLNGYVRKPVKKNDLFKTFDKVLHTLLYQTLTDRNKIEVLICDKSETSRLALRSLLKAHFKRDVFFYEASNGFSALEILNNNSIKLLVVDWDLPIKNGSEVIQEIRENPLNDALKIVLSVPETVTPSLSSDVRRKVNGFLKKPYDEEKVSKMLNMLIRRIGYVESENTTDSRALNILIADDSKMIRTHLNCCIGNYFIAPTVFEATDGFEALDILLHHRIDFLLLDYNMPNMTGLGVLRNIQANECFKDIKVLVVTSYKDASIVAMFKKIGIDLFLTKPLDCKTLQKALDRIMQERPF